MSSRVAIIGGGPVGMALALALHKQGVPSEIHDLRPRGAAAGDKRVLALSHGSQQTLAALGVWPQIKATAITNIHVSQRGGAGRTKISAQDEGVPALGHVASSSSISTALDQALTEADIPYFGESRLLDVQADDEKVVLNCSDGTLLAPLVAYAEGRIGEAKDVVERDYQQHALICHLTPVEPHQGRAWERFTTHGPFALLPHENGYAGVYICAPDDAERLSKLADAELLAHLQNEFGQRVRFSKIQNRFIYPLGLRYRPTAGVAGQRSTDLAPGCRPRLQSGFARLHGLGAIACRGARPRCAGSPGAICSKPTHRQTWHHRCDRQSGPSLQQRSPVAAPCAWRRTDRPRSIPPTAQLPRAPHDVWRQSLVSGRVCPVKNHD
jgi:hypothetical protein